MLPGRAAGAATKNNLKSARQIAAQRTAHGTEHRSNARKMPEQKLAGAFWRMSQAPAAEIHEFGSKFHQFGSTSSRCQHLPELDPNWSKLGPNSSMFAANAKEVLPKQKNASCLRAFVAYLFGFCATARPAGNYAASTLRVLFRCARRAPR